MALSRYELTGELYDDDEIRSFYENDIVNLDTEQREAITFKSWLQVITVAVDEFRGDETMRAERGWIGDPQPSVEWRDSHYSRQADRINTQPDPLRGEGGHDAELARRIPPRPLADVSSGVGASNG